MGTFLKSVNMTAVGVFIGANVIFIVGFAILFVCQKRILSKAWFPNPHIKLKFNWTNLKLEFL